MFSEFIEANKLTLLCSLTVLALLAVVPCTMADDGLTASEVWSLLPKGPDVDDDFEIANYEKLVAQGKSIYGVLLDIVRSNNSPLVAGRALAVIRASNGAEPNARREVVAELGKVLEERKILSGPLDARMLSLLAEAIADMGDAGDAKLLVPLLDHPNKYVRSACRSSMEKLTAKAVSLDSPVGGEPFAHDNSHVATESEPVPQAKKTYQDYPEWESFPKGMDSEDEEQVTARRRLVEQGESAYEALLAIVRECDDPYVVSSALSILRSSQGDKTEVVSQLKEFLPTRLPGESRDDEIVIVDTASALADMGKDGDLDVLIPMLSNPSWQVRSVGIMLLGNYGGQKTLKALKEARESNPGGLALKGMDEAISGIESRLAEQDAEATPSP